GGSSSGTKTAVVTGSGTTYDVAVSGMTSDGTVTAKVNANAASDAATNPNTASGTASVTFKGSKPSATIVKAATQAAPTPASPIHFTVTFSESVTGFGSGGLTLGGTASPTTAAVTASRSTYYD